MRTIVTRSVLLGAVAYVAFAGSAVAQIHQSAILNTLEVQKLAASTNPEDQASLVAHFGALAERYTAEAKRHESMAASFGGNPNRNLGIGMRPHCTRIAELNMQSAVTLRELALHHQKLAAGAPSVPPSGAAAFHGGLGAREPSEKELKALAANARSAADHAALEEYFRTAAKRYTAAADAHVTFAQMYRGTRLTWAPGIHEHLAMLSRESAKEAAAAAARHNDLAGIAR